MRLRKEPCGGDRRGAKNSRPSHDACERGGLCRMPVIRRRFRYGAASRRTPFPSRAACSAPETKRPTGTRPFEAA